LSKVAQLVKKDSPKKLIGGFNANKLKKLIDTVFKDMEFQWKKPIGDQI